jgi:paraquat-inducible protein B
MEEITKSVTQIVRKLEKLPLEQIGNNLRDILEQSQTTLVKLDRLLDAESPTGHELKRALSELADAAHNLNVLTDYLGRHPESLIFGKDKRNEK